MARLLLPKKLYFRSLLAEAFEQCASQPIDVIDFAQIDWVQPSGLAALACLVRLQQRTHPVAAEHATASPAFRYFQDMDFFRQFNNYTLEDFSRIAENRAFARLAEINATSNSSAIARNLAKIVAGHARPIHNDLFTCLEESVRNVIDWAGSPGYAVAQTQPVAGGERTYNIAICDYGSGIREVLSRNPRYAKVGGQEALAFAVQKGVSTAVAPGQGDNFGIGLYEIDRIAETTKGRLILGSGEWVRIREADQVRYEATPHWQGTAVELTLYLSGFRIVHEQPTLPRRLRFG